MSMKQQAMYFYRCNESTKNKGWFNNLHNVTLIGQVASADSPFKLKKFMP